MFEREIISELRGSGYLLPATFYCAFAALTFAYLLRHGRSGLYRRGLQFGAALVWPLYWPAVHDLRSCLKQLWRAIVVVWFFGAAVELAGFWFVDRDPCYWVACLDKVTADAIAAPLWPLKLLQMANARQVNARSD